MLPEYLIKVHGMKDIGDEKQTLLGRAFLD